MIRAGAGLFYGVLPLLAANWADNPTRTITQFNPSGEPIASPVTYANAYTAGLNPLASPAAFATGYHTPQRHLECRRGSGIAQEPATGRGLPQQPHKLSLSGRTLHGGIACRPVVLSDSPTPGLPSITNWKPPCVIPFAVATS